MEPWRPATIDANMTAVLTRAAQVLRGMRRDDSHPRLSSWTVLLIRT